MNCLVTGATGFVGSWLTKRLVEEGHSVKVLRRSSSDISEIDNLDIEHCIGDVTDFDSLKAAATGVDHIFHLAGVVGYSRAARGLMEKVNVDGTQNVVDVCKSLNLGRLLHFSSVVAIGAGRNKNEVLNEDSSFNIHDLNLGYFETKYKAEVLVRNAVDKGELDAVMVNPSTIYGPGDAKKGSRKTQLKVAQGKFPFYTSGGVNIVSIHDVINCTLQAFNKGRTGERYILAGENILIKELFQIIAEEAGVNAPGIYLPDALVHAIGKYGDLMESLGKKGPLNSENAWTSTMFHWFDNSKAKKELGLDPKSARQSIGESIDWVKQQGWLS